MLSGKTVILTPCFMYRMTRDPLAFLEGIRRRYGPFARVKTGLRTFYMTTDPEVIRQVLVSEASSFIKSRGLEIARSVLGNGLLTSNGDFHLRQRRLVQPAFHRQRLVGYADKMVAATRARMADWKEGQQLDLAQEMMAVTLEIITLTMFTESIGHRVAMVSQAMEEIIRHFHIGLIPVLALLERLPLAQARRFRQAREQLDEVLMGLIRSRRANPQDTGDLLSMLLSAVDEQDGRGMSDHQVRDEAMTIFLAGHETTAAAITWTLALLAHHPPVLERLYSEVDEVLQGRAAGADDLARLPLMRKVLLESMRLYPPAWILARACQRAVVIGDQPLAPGNVVIMSPWVAHRRPEYFSEPERFWPDRWEGDWEKHLPKFAYFPFGGGNRVCIGEHFARMENVLVLATLLQSWRFHPLRPEMPLPLPRITLRLSQGFPVSLRRR